MQEQGMQGDPRYSQLMAVAKRAKHHQQQQQQQAMGGNTRLGILSLKGLCRLFIVRGPSGISKGHFYKKIKRAMGTLPL